MTLDAARRRALPMAQQQRAVRPALRGVEADRLIVIRWPDCRCAATKFRASAEIQRSRFFLRTSLTSVCGRL